MIKTITLLITLTIVSSGFAAIEADSACVPELTFGFTVDSQTQEGETANTIAASAIFDTPQTPPTGTTYDICNAAFQKYGFCVTPSALVTWKTAMRNRRKKRNDSIKVAIDAMVKNQGEYKKLNAIMTNSAVKAKLVAFGGLKRQTRSTSTMTVAELKAAQATETTAINGQTELQFYTGVKSIADTNSASTDVSVQASTNQQLLIRFMAYLKQERENSDAAVKNFIKKCINILSTNVAWATKIASFSIAVNARVVTLTPAQVVPKLATRRRILATFNKMRNRNLQRTVTANTDVKVTAQVATVATLSGDASLKADADIHKKFKEVRIKCLTALNIIRGNTLCIRASGAAGKFYDFINKRYVINLASCKDVVPICAPFFLMNIRSNKLVNILMQLRIVLDSSVSAGDKRDLSYDATMEAKWKTCSDEGETACAAKDAEVTVLCGDLSLNAENPLLEGSPRASKAGKQMLDKVKDGSINTLVTAAASASASTRILQTTEESVPQEGQDGTTVDNTGGADVSKNAVDMNSGDAEDAKAENAGTADDEEEFSMISSTVMMFFIIGLFNILF